MKNRYEGEPKLLQQILIDLLDRQMVDMSKASNKKINAYEIGYLQGLEHITNNDVKQYSKLSKNDLNKAIQKDSQAAEKEIKPQTEITNILEIEELGNYEGISSAYQDVYNLCYGKDQEILSKLDEVSDTFY